ncbi:MAG: ComF family protein [Chitinophagaceae bacterium]|nr:ComF family protein [Chitinophagaceae bacterium]
MKSAKKILKDLLHIFFPHLCAGCGNDIADADAIICIRCLEDLGTTNFNTVAGNLTEKIFSGRLPIINASSLCYFSKDSLVRHLMHQLKYRDHKELGYFLGRLMGASLRQTDRFADIDGLVPLPLFFSREKKRGYNQATILCEGMAAAMQLPVWKDVVTRTSFTDSQTKKNRTERWQNIEGRFELQDIEKLTGRHVLLVDDVVTTGATLEACGLELLRAPGAKLSISTLACALN